MRATLEGAFNRGRLDYQPWHDFLHPAEVPADMKEEQKAVQDLLSVRCGATFSGCCFVSARANVFTDRLHMDDGAWIAACAIVRRDVRLGHATSINP